MKHPKVSALAWLAAALVGLGGLVLIAGLATFYYLAPTLPDVATLRDMRMQVPLRVYSRDGRLLAQIGEQRRIPVAFEDIPEPLVDAFLAAEDDRFFQHGGIDTPGLIRALFVTATTGQATQGGSTITMQVARNMFLTPEKNLRRKLREIFLAFRIERQFSKQEILTLYLNKIFLGQRAYGVAAAAEVYFGKKLAELNLAEIATIAALPKAPSQLNPIASPERARQRRAYVLRRMLDKGYITAAEHDAAVSAPMQSQEHGPRVELDAPYIAEMVRATLFDKYGEDIYTAGYRVTTTVDSRLQHAADVALRATLLEYDRRHGYRGPVGKAERLPQNAAEAEVVLERLPPIGGLPPAVVMSVAEKSLVVHAKGLGKLRIDWDGGLSWARKGDLNGNVGAAPKTAGEIVKPGDVVYVLPTAPGVAFLAQVPAVQGAFVAIDPQDGGVVALSGGFDFYDSKFNRAVQARRQPGSSFKPFVYSAALEQGFTPASVILDAPVVFEGASSEDDWRPENDSKRFYGPTRLREALARSRNLVSIRILRAVGVPFVVDYVQKFGFKKDELPPNLTLALGTAEVTPMEMASGYTVFANGGYRVEPYVIERVEDADGKVLMAAAPKIVCHDCGAEQQAPTDGAAVAGTSETVSAPQPPALVVRSQEGGVTRLADLAGSSKPELTAAQIAPLAVSPANVYIMTDIMRDVIRRGTAQRALALNRNDLAGKTGTTNDKRDAWFAGFNADLVGTAWVGFDQERSLGNNEEGGRTALPMWIYFMKEALRGRPEHRLPTPVGVVTARISPTTGQVADAGDPNAIFEMFIEGHLPGEGSGSYDGGPADQPLPNEEPIF